MHQRVSYLHFTYFIAMIILPTWIDGFFFFFFTWLKIRGSNTFLSLHKHFSTTSPKICISSISRERPTLFQMCSLHKWSQEGFLNTPQWDQLHYTNVYLRLQHPHHPPPGLYRDAVASRQFLVWIPLQVFPERVSFQPKKLLIESIGFSKLPVGVHEWLLALW